MNLFHGTRLGILAALMAVVESKSTQITNRDATPRVMNNPGSVAGVIRGFAATLEAGNGDSIGSKYRMARVPSNAFMHSLRLYCDDLGTTTVADIGLYDTSDNGGAVVDADFFASAVVMNAGALNGSDILHEAATVYDIDKVEKPLWQCLGLASDPKKDYDVVLTLTAACDGAGTVTLKGTYAV
jgi:hypothetical protein